MNLLKLGFQYGTEKPILSYLTDLVTETENAIKMLDTNIKSAYRVKATKN
jgi:hypothetical protein